MDNNKLMKKVIYAKGITLTQAAREIEVGYHSLIKTLTPSVHIKKGGNEFRVRECRYIREALAEWLECPYDIVWGKGSEFFLRRLILEEVDNQCNARCELEKSQKKKALGL